MENPHSLPCVSRFLLDFYRAQNQGSREDDGEETLPFPTGVDRDAAALLLVDFECFLDLVLREVSEVVGEDHYFVQPEDLEQVIPTLLRRMRG